MNYNALNQLDQQLRTENTNFNRECVECKRRIDELRARNDQIQNADLDNVDLADTVKYYELLFLYYGHN